MFMQLNFIEKVIVPYRFKFIVLRLDGCGAEPCSRENEAQVGSPTRLMRLGQTYDLNVQRK